MTRADIAPDTPLRLDIAAAISDEHLLRRAVGNARGRKYRRGEKHQRWIAVMDTFALGSTFSRQLCRRFHLDPDEVVKR